jgi:hypothetical protein
MKNRPNPPTLLLLAALAFALLPSLAIAAPPGPFDIIRGILGGGFKSCYPEEIRCARDGDAVCCSKGDRCCTDAEGPYCCGSREHYSRHGRHGSGTEDPTYTCNEADLTCSRDGKTVCCSGGDQCCADANGPYCCTGGSASGGPRDDYH